MGALIDPHDRLEEPREHPLAVDASQSQGNLGLDDSELDAEVMPRAAGFERQVLLAASQGIQGGCELDTPALAYVAPDQIVQQVEHRGCQDVHPEEAEVMPRAESGDLEAKLGQGRIGLLEDLVDDVDVR